MVAQAVQFVEISGHLIDSLTLAKVIDKIQQAQCRYQITEIQIGTEKQDLSYARIALMGDQPSQLSPLLEELKPYGIRTLTYDSVHTEPAPADGTVPFNSFIVPQNELQLLLDGQWLHVDNHEVALVIVVDPTTRSARSIAKNEVKAGQAVVVGETGMKMLPAYHHE